MLIGILSWLMLGLVAGFVASRFVNLRDDDPRVAIGLSGLAALVGGCVYTALSGHVISRFNLGSLLCAAIAAVASLVIWHRLRRASYPPARRPW